MGLPADITVNNQTKLTEFVNMEHGRSQHRHHHPYLKVHSSQSHSRLHPISIENNRLDTTKFRTLFYDNMGI